MIGHFINQLTEEQEDRLLERRLRSGSNGAGTIDDSPGAGEYVFADGSGCVVGLALGYELGRHGSYLPKERRQAHLTNWGRPQDDICIETYFDLLCLRFGESRIGQAIRARILSNRLWRTLAAGKPHLEAVR